jgi:hypothetical protein
LQQTRRLAGRTLTRIIPVWKAGTKPRIWGLVAWCSPDCPARQRDALCLWQKWQPSLGAPPGKLKQPPLPLSYIPPSPMWRLRPTDVCTVRNLGRVLHEYFSAHYQKLESLQYSLIQHSGSLPLSRSFEFRGLGKNSRSLS